VVTWLLAGIVAGTLRRHTPLCRPLASWGPSPLGHWPEPRSWGGRPSCRRVYGSARIHGVKMRQLAHFLGADGLEYPCSIGVRSVAQAFVAGVRLPAPRGLLDPHFGFAMRPRLPRGTPLPRRVACFSVRGGGSGEAACSGRGTTGRHCLHSSSSVRISATRERVLSINSSDSSRIAVKRVISSTCVRGSASMHRLYTQSRRLRGAFNVRKLDEGIWANARTPPKTPLPR